MHFNNDTDLYRTIGSNIKHYRQQAKFNTDAACRKGSNQYQLSF